MFDRVSKLDAGKYSASFETAWAEYPKRDGGNPKAGAWRAWCATVKRVGHGAEAWLAAGIRRYADYARKSKILDSKFVMHAKTFLGADERWREPWEFNGAEPARSLWRCHRG